MDLKNRLVINKPKLNINIKQFIKQQIAIELDTTIENVGFKNIPNGFEFIWDRDLKGNIRITFENIESKYIIVESENSWDAVEFYNLFFNWIDKLDS